VVGGKGNRITGNYTNAGWEEFLIEDFIRQLGLAHENRDTSGIYFVNLPQARKFQQAVELAKEYAKNSFECKVEIVPKDEKELHGYFNIHAPLFHFHGRELEILKEISNLVDVVCVFCNSDDSVSFEFNVNNIYIKQEV
jgi:hypothetical protein